MLCGRLTFFNRSSGKTLKTLSANHASSQARIIPPSITPSTSTSESIQLKALNRLNPVSDGDDLDITDQAVGGEIGMDEDNELLTAVRQASEATKRNHKGGTQGVSQS